MAKAVSPRRKEQRARKPPAGGPPDNHEFLRTIIETTPECVKVVAPDGRLVQMNQAGLRMIAAESWETVGGTSALDLIAPEHRDAWRAYHDRVCRGESQVWEFDIIALDGSRRHMETHATPIRLADGTMGQLGLTRDITDRTNAARQQQRLNEALERKVRQRTDELEGALASLKATERSFELLVNGVTDYAVFMLDTDGRVVSWNAGAERIKGYAAAEIIGRHFSCFYTEEDRKALLPLHGLQTAAREGRFEREGWRVRKDGKRFWAHVVIDAIHDGGRLVGFAKITRDITERKAAEAQLRQSQKMEAIGQFTGGAAHDFNNLLTAIAGSLELLRKRLPADARMLALLDNAMQGAKRGASLTQRMLAFARRQELKQEAIDPASLVSGMSELLEHTVGPTVAVDIAIPRHIPPVRTDANQLETALLNLALNARDAMPHGGRITISAREAQMEAGDPSRLAPGAYVCLCVSDTGQGMDEATLARVTEPFFTTKGVGKGTGLGLSMVDGLVAQSGGKLTIRSQPGQGTTIELWLPVADNEALVATEAPVEPQHFGPAENQLVILAVDDDSLVLANLAVTLEDLGHTVIDVTSGAKALEVIETGSRVDLVISDQVMPGMTGLQLIEAIKTRMPKMPAILATGYAELPPGIDPTVRRLAKPYSQRQLADAVTASVHR